MVAASQTSKDARSERVLESQLRASFGRVVYSHKTHEKAADIILSQLSLAKLSYIVLSTLAAAGFGFDSIASESIGSVLGAIFSSVLLAINLFTKDQDLAGLAHKHRQAASDIWLVREKYEALIADLSGGLRTLCEIRDTRDCLMNELHEIYSKSPPTNSRAYKKAQKALKVDEEMTFEDREIDEFLPDELRRSKE